MQRRRFFVGSMSPIKRDAVAKAFGVRKDCIVCCDVKSGIPEQPVGKKQTQEGAHNRCVGASHDAAFDAAIDVAIGIENGMWRNDNDDENETKKENLWLDGACIAIKMPSSSEVEFVWSDTIVIPPDHPPGPHGMWSKLKDPHIEICGRLRKDILADAMTQWLKK